jgi:hypothetical protein
VTLDALRKGLQNIFNVQKPLTNVEKIIKFYTKVFHILFYLTILKLQYFLI